MGLVSVFLFEANEDVVNLNGKELFLILFPVTHSIVTSFQNLQRTVQKLGRIIVVLQLEATV